MSIMNNITWVINFILLSAILYAYTRIDENTQILLSVLIIIYATLTILFASLVSIFTKNMVINSKQDLEIFKLLVKLKFKLADFKSSNLHVIEDHFTMLKPSKDSKESKLLEMLKLYDAEELSSDIDYKSVKNWSKDLKESEEVVYAQENSVTGVLINATVLYIVGLYNLIF